MVVSAVEAAFACPFHGEKVPSVGAATTQTKVLNSKIVQIHL